MYSYQRRGKRSQQRGPCRYLLGKKWYYRLIPSDYPNGWNPSLLDEYPEHTLHQKIVVGLEMHVPPTDSGTVEGKKVGSRCFALFNSYIELYRYQCSFHPEERCFFEILLGDFPQKPHFDVDVSIQDVAEGKAFEHVGDAVRQELIACILEVGKEKGIAFDLERDILVYKSHGDHKRSYHIVVHHYCHVDHEQAKGFYKAVTKKMKPELAAFVDNSVYSSRQNFRLLGSQKPTSFRPKRFCETFLYRNREITHSYEIAFRNEEHKQVEIFKESLVGWVSGCTHLPSFVEKKLFSAYGNVGAEDYGDLSENNIEEAMKLFRETPVDPAKTSHSFPFTIRDVKGSIISLKRLRPSFCPICKRRHEHENPYLLVVGGNVYFCCRRSGSENLFLGMLSSDYAGSFGEDGSEEKNAGEDKPIFRLGSYSPPTPAQKKKPQEKVKKTKNQPRLRISKKDLEQPISVLELIDKAISPKKAPSTERDFEQTKAYFNRLRNETTYEHDFTHGK